MAFGGGGFSMEPGGLLDRRESGPRDLRALLLGQDVVYVGGGCLLSMLAVWRAHGLDAILREAWAAGVLLCGLSAGSLCWYATGLTAYHHDARPYDGLGLLPHSNAVHYEDEPDRRPRYHAALLAGMPGGYAASDGAALHFEGTELARVVTSRPGARAFRVDAVDGEVVEHELATTCLAPPVPVLA